MLTKIVLVLAVIGIANAMPDSFTFLLGNCTSTEGLTVKKLLTECWNLSVRQAQCAIVLSALAIVAVVYGTIHIIVMKMFYMFKKFWEMRTAAALPAPTDEIPMEDFFPGDVDDVDEQ
ncbi:unnamed protein product [Orchesella dallaii]|uniref:Uncharacterized protein n=1 Tax=Orchesella dallaii TaxID=48710 RepID=A0ABP1PU33_9HEXA